MLLPPRLLSGHYLEWNHGRALLQPVQVIGPCLHHLSTFGKVRRPIVCPSVRISYGMGNIMNLIAYRWANVKEKTRYF
jgi:hypothetical protein